MAAILVVMGQAKGELVTSTVEGVSYSPAQGGGEQGSSSGDMCRLCSNSSVQLIRHASTGVKLAISRK